MPQLDVATFLPQLVWLGITFVALYLLMARIALPRIGEVLDARQKRIDGNLEKAEALKEEAEAAREAYEKSLEEARAGAHAKLTAAADRLADEATQRRHALEETLEVQAKAAEERIHAARTEALGEVHAIAKDIAADAAAKLIGARPDGKAIADALEAAARGQE